jgi:hypothetical protein
MTNAELMTKHEAQEQAWAFTLSFEFRASFVIRHSSFGITANLTFVSPKRGYYLSR